MRLTGVCLLKSCAVYYILHCFRNFTLFGDDFDCLILTVVEESDSRLRVRKGSNVFKVTLFEKNFFYEFHILFLL